jgi:hypothetical protein
VLNAAAVGLALAAGAVPALADTGTRESVTVGPGGTVRRTSESTSDPGLGLVGLAIAALCAIPLLLRRPEHAATARRVLAVGLVAFSLVGAMSIGLLFLPSALAMLAAALTSRDR